MSINIKTDPLRSAILFGRPVLFASQRIPREEVPESWYYYELRGSVRNAKKPVALSDHAYVNPIGSVLSPVPLKRADTISRRVNGQFLLLGETTTLRDYCWNNGLEYPFPNQTFAVRPASPEEAGIFYAQTPEQDTALGAIGHVRMDFGRSGKDFWHTWHPRGPEELNNTAFKAELQEVMDELRASVLKDYNAMTRYCESHGGKIDGGWVQNYGYIIETEGYRQRAEPARGGSRSKPREVASQYGGLHPDQYHLYWRYDLAKKLRHRYHSLPAGSKPRPEAPLLCRAQSPGYRKL